MAWPDQQSSGSLLETTKPTPLGGSFECRNRSLYLSCAQITSGHVAMIPQTVFKNEAWNKPNCILVSQSTTLRHCQEKGGEEPPSEPASFRKSSKNHEALKKFSPCLVTYIAHYLPLFPEFRTAGRQHEEEYYLLVALSSDERYRIGFIIAILSSHQFCLTNRFLYSLRLKAVLLGSCTPLIWKLESKYDLFPYTGTTHRILHQVRYKAGLAL